jgi:hypothetical protein
MSMQESQSEGAKNKVPSLLSSPVKQRKLTSSLAVTNPLASDFRLRPSRTRLSGIVNNKKMAD